MKLAAKISSDLASLVVTTITLTLSNIFPAFSESIPISPQLHQQPILIAQQRDCIPSSSNEYIYGTYKVQWTFQGLSYESVLQMEGSSGQMLTRYFNPNTNSPDLVLQTMKLYTCSFGLVIAGYNPRNPNTQNSHPSYIADNLLIRRQPDGSLLIFNCDDQENCSPATVE
ncbi:hypothetical protein [Limnoraphis robusta]|uniref:Uncharacterized protein n=1 Tax=Limnoraphis robusta CCNP1315 TaxID=3110306 RepID=A0ABU5U4I9_9CYAN|nr:hypothetical protein [Limnoraphis robusta]MEA5497956.1 hypothetical protein [Limnoraphis robusta BA-68 BA1]MEA5522107.1 hypothetical protein [Limnoraphis robusta CCNP1315]MEA5544189.1 hypothetical protein [Limnoraphis robusta CCNP1324]